MYFLICYLQRKDFFGLYIYCYMDLDIAFFVFLHSVSYPSTGFLVILYRVIYRNHDEIIIIICSFVSLRCQHLHVDSISGMAITGVLNLSFFRTIPNSLNLLVQQLKGIVNVKKRTKKIVRKDEQTTLLISIHPLQFAISHNKKIVQEKDLSLFNRRLS